MSAFGPILDPVLSKTSSNRSFVVRAESNPEGEGGAVKTAEENEAGDSEAAETEAGVETAVMEELRKPRVKLGDIMGVNSVNYLANFFLIFYCCHSHI